MLRTLIVSPNAALARRLEQALEPLGPEIAVCRTLDGYPDDLELRSALRAHAPGAVFLDFHNLTQAVRIARTLEGAAPGLQIVAIHRECDASLLRETMRLGVRESLAEPFDRAALMDALSNVKALLERRSPVYESTDHVVAILPSKAGVGASTLALNVAAALARRCGGRALLADLDLNAGMTRFLLKLDNPLSVMDALEHSPRLDETRWRRMVASRDTLDVLHAGRVQPEPRIDPERLRGLVDFMRRNYQAVCFDLSGGLEPHSIEAMNASSRILLVCTPEIPSLHLAREKAALLRGLGLESRVFVVLNRMARRAAFTRDQVEEVLNLKVAAVFGNDYAGVSRAAAAGELLTPESSLGRRCAELAGELLRQRPAQEYKRKFLEFFSVPRPAHAEE
jgi:pilus assembly protein CpaE